MTQIGSRIVVYDGIAQSKPEQKYDITRESVVKDIAVFLGGYIAKQMAAQNPYIQEAGKGNDIQLANHIALSAILKHGLSPRWGFNRAMPAESDQTMIEFLKALPLDEQKLVQEEVHALLAEGEALARSYLEANFNDGVSKIAVALAEKGILEKDEIQQVHSQFKVVHPKLKRNYEIKVNNWFSRQKEKVKDLFKKPLLEDQTILRPDVQRPTHAALPEKIIADKKKAAINQVPAPSWLKDFTTNCEILLLPAPN